MIQNRLIGIHHPCECRTEPAAAVEGFVEAQVAILRGDASVADDAEDSGRLGVLFVKMAVS